MSERGNDYSGERDLPDIVRRAADLADRMGFRNSCAVAYGRFLRVLAAGVPAGSIGEMGTGCGVGTAWMSSAARPGVGITTMEIDPSRAAAAATLFADSPNVTVVEGDALDLGEHGPFDLLFCDGGGKTSDQERTIAMLAPGGMVVLDDLTPGRQEPDPVREFWLGHDDLIAIEVTLTPELAAIVAVRR